MLFIKKQKYLIWVITIVLIGSIMALGCSKQTDSEASAILPNEGDLIIGDTLNLDDFVHYDVNQTLYYNGIADFSQFASCVRIDEIISPSKGKLYYFEGEVEDLSGEISGDYSFYKAYKVTEDYCSEYYDDQHEMILLKSNIEVGTSWQTMMIEPQLGLVEINAMVKKVTDDEITVDYQFDDEHIPSDQQYTLEYVFRLGNGIVKKKQIYSDFEVEFNLTQKSSDTPNTFVPRYNKPSELISKIYSEPYFENLLVDATFKKEIRDGQLSDSDLYDHYENYLGALKANQMGSISRSKEALLFCMDYTENPLKLVRRFIEFYENNCYDYGYEWVESLGLYDLSLFESLFIYDDQIDEIVVNPEATGENRVLGAFLVENGMSLKTEEGNPYFSTSGQYLSQSIYTTDPLSKDYVTLKKLQYQFFPIQSDGYLMVSADQLATAIKTFDTQYQAHRDLEAFEDAKYLADYLFEVYILPNDYFLEGYNYSGGYITEPYLESYERYIEENPESSYTPILINIVKLLKSNANVYTKALESYLIELGYSPNRESSSLRFLQLDEFESITKDQNRIVLNPKASEVISVTNINEFLEAVGSNRTIYLEPGRYEIPYTSPTDNVHVAIDEGTLRIKNVDDMTVVSKSGLVDIIADSYFEVLILDGCHNIQMDGLRMGHLREYCVGDVLEVKASSNLELNRLILFGCGYNGLYLDLVKGLSLSNTLISDCQSCGLVFKDVENITITNTGFHRNGRHLFDFKSANNIILNKVIATDNGKESYEEVSALMTVDENSSITIIDSELDTTYVKKMIEGEGAVIQ